MGSGSSRNKKVNRQVQVPSASKVRQQIPSPTRPSSYSGRPFSSQPSTWAKKTNTHKQSSNSSLAQYASIWEPNGKLSSTFQQLIRSESTTKIEHTQKETNNQHLVTKHTSTCQSAKVQSILTTDIQSIHNLSTSDRLDTLIYNLKQTQLDFDESVKRRIGQITSETESILAQIFEETQKIQQELLIHAKEQQTIQDEEYRILLEEFIAQLDKKRAQQLSLIQEQLQQQRLQIFNESELKIRALNEQANSLKNQIMSEEERKASEKIDSIVTEIHSITNESAIQQLGTETKTNFNLMVYEKVGSNKSGELFQFDSDDQSIYNGTNQQNIKRTTFISNDNTLVRTSSSRLSNHQPKSINQLAKLNPVNPKTKSQQPQ